MANVPTIVVGTGNQQKVVTPALLTGLDSTGAIVALRVDASGNLLTSGGAGGGGAAVISVANYTGDPVLDCLQFVNVVMAFDTVVQNTLIYDTDTGIFTIPSNGTYLLEYGIALPVAADEWYSGNATVLLNDTPISGIFPALASDAVAFVSSTIFNAVAGDEVKVTCIINTATGDTPVLNGAKLQLVKL
jgi:hypothetical protein